MRTKMSKREDLVALARSKVGQWYYTNDEWARMNPEESGGTDCSGFARWVFKQFGYDIGIWTGDESGAGSEVARGHYAWEVPWDIMLPGDLIFMTATYKDNYNFDEYLCHVEIYCGNGTMIGHPGGYGPQEKWAQAWMDAYNCITWKVMRVVEDDVPDEWPLQMYVSNGTNAQNFGITHYKDGTFALTCIADGRCIDVKWASKDNGTEVRGYTPNGTLAQRWHLVQKKGGYKPVGVAPYEIVSALDENKCLDVVEGSQEWGAKLCLWERHGGRNQEWYILDNGDGTWTIVNNNAKKLVIDCVGAGR